MKCSKCNITLPNKSKYCIRCGEIFDYTYITEEKTTEDILFEYVTSEKKYTNGFSIYYLLFNFIYAFYKKMYIEGIISLISVLGLITILKNFINLLYASMGFNFLFYAFLILIFSYFVISYVFNFDNLYVEHILRIICRIVSDNKEDSIEELKKKCKNECNDSLMMAIFSIILFLVGIIIINGLFL